ncbi:hypothetical protein WMF30_10535 [Sorangium sp. So ce134]
MRASPLTLALLLVSSAAAASEPYEGREEKPWSAHLGVGNIWIGGERPTGGLTITGGARRAWRLGDGATFDAGVSGEAFGFAGSSRWMGVLVGPVVGATWRLPVEGLTGGIAASLDYGRVPACTDWGLCLRYRGVVPGAAGRLAYGNQVARLTAEVRVKWIDTSAWEGPSVGLLGGGVVSW